MNPVKSPSSSSSRIINFEIRREQHKTRLVVSTVKEVSHEYREPVSSAPHHPLLRRRSNGTCLCERNSVVSRRITWSSFDQKWFDINFKWNLTDVVAAAFYTNNRHPPPPRWLTNTSHHVVYTTSYVKTVTYTKGNECVWAPSFRRVFWKTEKTIKMLDNCRVRVFSFTILPVFSLLFFGWVGYFEAAG